MRMHKGAARAFWILFCGLLQLSQAHAQTVYRCEGTQYSQSPCPSGMAVDVSDVRTRDQKAAQDSATQRSAAFAKKLEQERLALENAAKPAQSRKLSSKPKPAPSVGSTKPKKSAKPAPEWFVAATEAKDTAGKNPKAPAAKSGKASKSAPTAAAESPAKPSPRKG